MEIACSVQRKVAEAVTRFQMVREGDRIAVGLSGGKDSVTLLEALLELARRAPIHFSVEAFTIEQGKFLAPIEPLGEYLQRQGVKWTYFTDRPSLRLMERQPDHGCDVCSRFRRRAVYEVAKSLGVNVIALGHTADDLCESFLRNALFNGQLSALPPVTYSRNRDFRLIRPLLFVTEEQTRQYVASLSAPVIPCGCSQKTGTVRRSLRHLLDELAADHPQVRDSLLAAMGNIKPERLLDLRYLGGEAADETTEDLLPVLAGQS